MILFFDTETTGFANFREPVSSPVQPHLVQLAWMLCEDDGAVIRQMSSVVRCPIDVPGPAFNVHGISRERSEDIGMDLIEAVNAFEVATNMADTFAAHNARFDQVVMGAAFSRARRSDPFGDKNVVCTMKLATPIMRLPPTERMRAAGRNHHKSPNLQEAYKHFTGADLVGAHDAMVDVSACKEVFFKMKELHDAA